VCCDDSDDALSSNVEIYMQLTQETFTSHEAGLQMKAEAGKQQFYLHKVLLVAFCYREKN